MDVDHIGSRIYTNGHELYYEVHGPEGGPVVILLHHGLGSVRAWKGQILALVEAGLRVVVYDRWGYGASSPRTGIDIPLFEDDRLDLLALQDTLGIQRPHLVGHSDGGTIAMYFAAAHPERLTSLVSIAAHIYVEEKMKAGIFLVRDNFDPDLRLAEGLKRLHGEQYLQVFQNWFDGWVSKANLSWDMRPVLWKISCPTLIAQGVEDEYATPQHAADIAAAIPGAGLWLEAGAGHMLPQEKPHEFNRRVIDFIGRAALS